MLAAAGIYLTPRSRVLDFGCGSGKTVYQYRDCGFDAYGFDLANDVELRQADDAALFRFASTAATGKVADYRLTGGDYRIAFDPASFDFVCSNSVFEHVQDHDLALREIARVLRPGGLSIHIFPARYSLMEPHMFVPLGGIIRNLYWYRLWALMGIRNRFQHGMSSTEAANANLHYSQTGINYPPVGKLLEIARRYFAEATLAPQLWTIGSFRHPLVRIPLLGWLYSRLDTVVLWLKR
jgi:SAM-dependent methyltransferase